MFSSNVRKYLCVSFSIGAPLIAEDAKTWNVDSQDEWESVKGEVIECKVEEGRVVPLKDTAVFRSKIKSFDEKRKVSSITVEQIPDWANWEEVDNIGPSNLRDAPVFLSLGPNDYWIFGRYGKMKQADDFKSEEVKREGYDVPLVTTPDPLQFNAPGGLNQSKGGYHAWHSRDMKHWVHFGPVTEGFSKWVTTAEYVDGKAYIYYDYPNDQDPHVYVDEDLMDGKPGKNMGIAFKDPSDGSDCGVIRGLDGNFHMIYEDWTPINARKHSWDSPLGGYSVSKDGLLPFDLQKPAVDERTKPTGKTATYMHPHWKKEHPDFDSNEATYEIHEPEQNAFGDWAAISVGGQYYLFCDYHPANDKIRVAWFTSSGIDKPFRRCGEIGLGHPDPDIGFAEGKFHLITQMRNDYVSSGPWVDTVEVRVGVDSSGDGSIDVWSDWGKVSESYDYIEGYAKQIGKEPAKMDLTSLPEGKSYQFEVKMTKTTENGVLPVLDKVSLEF